MTRKCQLCATVEKVADDWNECDAFGSAEQGPETGFAGSALLGNFTPRDSPRGSGADASGEATSAPAASAPGSPRAACADASAAGDRMQMADDVIAAGPVAGGATWDCVACTFKNPISRRKCEMCRAVRQR